MAKNSILDITIRLLKQGGADKEVVKGLAAVKGAVTNVMGTFAALAGVAYTLDKVLEATAGKAVEYSNKVEGIANGTGLSAESSSRLIQVTDDLRVSYDDLSASIKKNSDVTDFSMQGLAALSAEYLALATVEEQQAFAQEHFGKQWVEFTKVLKTGPDALLAMNDAVSENLIMTQDAMDAAKEYQENTDQLKDSWEGFTISLGNKTIPILNKVLENINLNVAQSEYLDEAMQLTNGNYRAANSLAYKMALADKEAADANKDLADAITTTGDAIAEIDYQAVLDTTLNLQKGYDDFADSQAKVAAKMAEVNAQLAAGDITAEEHTAQMAELNAQYDQNAVAAEEWAKRTVFAMLQTRVAAMEGGSEADKFSFLVNIGEQMGIIDEETATMAQSLNERMSTIDLSQPEAFYGLWKNIIDLPNEQTFTITTVQVGSVDDPYTTTEGEGGTNNRAIGGSVTGGQAYHVHQDEIFVPGTNGYMLTRQDAREIAAGKGTSNTTNSRSISIANLTINARGSVMDVLEELS